MKKKSNNGAAEKTTKRARALSVISYVLLTLAIIFCAVIVFQIITQGYVSVFGHSMFRVVTPSMEPEIPVGAIIISQKTDIEDIKKGDIVSFVSLEAYMNGRVVTHRVDDVKAVNGEVCLVTRGDANNSVDAYYVTEDNLVGRIIFNTDKDNFFIKAYEFITQKQVFFLIVILPMVIIAAILLKNGISNMNEEIRRIKEETIKQEIENRESDDDRAPGDGGSSDKT